MACYLIITNGLKRRRDLTRYQAFQFFSRKNSKSTLVNQLVGALKAAAADVIVRRTVSPPLFPDSQLTFSEPYQLPDLRYEEA